MPVRRIGQETFGFEKRETVAALDELGGLIDWAPVEAALDALPVARRGEAAWPPPALFRALLIAVSHDLSDVRLAEALDDRASFRRFCGFSCFEPTPERSAFVRFRRALVRHGLDRRLFDLVSEQLRARVVTVKTGTLVDATVIASASRSDEEAHWSGHRTRKAIHGYKAHVAADADTGLVERLDATLGNVHYGRACGPVVPDNPGAVYADSACRGAAFATHVWAREGDMTAQARLLAHNAAIHRIRARIEKIFGTWKHCCGLRRMRWRGLAKAAVQVRLTVHDAAPGCRRGAIRIWELSPPRTRPARRGVVAIRKENEGSAPDFIASHSIGTDVCSFIGGPSGGRSPPSKAAAPASREGPCA